MSESSDALKGYCLCGACRFELTGAPRWIGHCHCESCRRATASPMTTFIGQADGQWKWTGNAPQVYESSPGVRRSFCRICGTPVMFQADHYPGESHFYAALLENPNAVTPSVNFHMDEKLCWVHDGGSLPATEGLPES